MATGPELRPSRRLLQALTMRIMLFTRYSRLGASSRIRSLQYLDYLKSNGWTVDVQPLFSGKYLQSLYDGDGRVLAAFKGYVKRIWSLVSIGRYDLVWIEKELLPFLPAGFERILARLGPPYVVDYDDALFHRYDSHENPVVRLFLARKIDVVMRKAALVIAGNEYLANRARAAGSRNVEVIPSVVDLDRYRIAESVGESPLTVGWIGSPSTCHYLSILAPIIESLRLEFNVRFVAVGGGKEATSVPGWESLPWTEDAEVERIREFDVGIMPLLDTPWESGKCGYKLIQYMACGLPVVASPVGVNRDIVEHGTSGFLAGDPGEWEQSLRRLLGDHVLCRAMGREGRKSVESKYTLQVQAPRLESRLRDLVTSRLYTTAAPD